LIISGIVNWPTVTTLATPGAGDRAHHAGGEHRDLGRSAAGAAEQAERDVGEELDHPGAFEERAE
jgi:hypothetical protein